MAPNMWTYIYFLFLVLSLWFIVRLFFSSVTCIHLHKDSFRHRKHHFMAVNHLCISPKSLLLLPLFSKDLHFNLFSLCLQRAQTKGFRKSLLQILAPLVYYNLAEQWQVDLIYRCSQQEIVPFYQTGLMCRAWLSPVTSPTTSGGIVVSLKKKRRNNHISEENNLQLSKETVTLKQWT